MCKVIKIAAVLFTITLLFGCASSKTSKDTAAGKEQAPSEAPSGTIHFEAWEFMAMLQGGHGHGTLCFTGAGGPTPLIIHENWAVEEPKTTGPPLGVMEEIPYKEKTVTLEPGDSILLFSDGAIEIQNAEKKWLGVEGFTQILKNLNYPKSPLSMDTLEEQLLKFSNDIRLQDDITIIEARFSG